jgi:hypothetical protein
VAVFGGGALHRYSPAGQLDIVVTLPVSHPTSAAFGGEGLRDLFVATARRPLSGEQRAAQPLAGRLFRLTPASLASRSLRPVAHPASCRHVTGETRVGWFREREKRRHTGATGYDTHGVRDRARRRGSGGTW